MVKIFKIIIKNFFNFINLKRDCWVLYLGENDGVNIDNFKKGIILNPPKKKFWADPFLINFDGKDFVFFEEYCYIKEKGEIKCGEIINKKILNVKTIISSDYHLSYPSIIYLNGNFYLTPECSESKKLKVFKSVNFPYIWEIHTELLEGNKLADPTIFKDKNNNIWLFVNTLNEKNNFNSNLNIYKFKDENLNSLIPHKNNPVIKNFAIGRNAGNLYYNENGDLIRPSQNNSTNIYGASLNFSKINHLSLEEYSETLIENIKPNIKFGLKGIHHFTKTKEKFLYDGLFGVKF
jgi:hypothetical protein